MSETILRKHQTMHVLVTKNLAMTLGSALAETLATLSTARHCIRESCWGKR